MKFEKLLEWLAKKFTVVIDSEGGYVSSGNSARLAEEAMNFKDIGSGYQYIIH